MESPAGITTTDVFNWSSITKRIIYYRPYGDTTGDVLSNVIESEVSQDETVDWQTN